MKDKSAMSLLNQKVVPYLYACSPMHAHLAQDATRAEGPNIGDRGQHLTITILTFNRSHMVERLCRSISAWMPDFAGEILVADNGSTEEHIRKVRDVLAGLPFRQRLLTLGENLGVAPGRNRAYAAVETDWLLSIDDDVVFIDNPLPAIQRDLAILGCKFANLPLLNADGKTIFAYGGNLYVKETESGLQLDHGSVYEPRQPRWRDAPAHLDSFLMGTAALLEKKALQAVGGLDEQLRIGFEDTDLSIRIFRSGLKVGTIGTFSVIHDHQRSSDEYENIRYSPSVIEASARYMEKKYGFRVWHNGLIDWIEDKQGKPGDQGGKPRSVGPLKTPQRREKVALVADVDYWAFANIARHVKHELKEFEIDVLYVTDFANLLQLFLALDGYDLVHFLCRWPLKGLVTGAADRRGKRVGYSVGEAVRSFLHRTAVTAAIYDHLDLSGPEIHGFKETLSMIDGYAVCSQTLFDIYSHIDGYPPPAAVLPDGVDLDLFMRTNSARFDDVASRPLVVGWAGNSAWPKTGEEDAKGLRTIIRPALEVLSREGIVTVENFADRQHGLRPLAEMPDYYGSIDVYVCASETEGTPNPVLEAMACGVPVISTDVGIVREVFGPLQTELILPERSVDAMAAALRRLHNDPDLLRRLSTENLKSIATWNWKERARAFAPFFSSTIAKRNARCGELV